MENIEKRTAKIDKLVSLCGRTDLPKKVLKIIQEGTRAYEELSIGDSLTELYNRRHFNDSLEKEIARSKRHNHPLSLVMLDVDNFKYYNDAYGHVEGDVVLREIGSAIKAPIRNIDIPCRYGGEEFVVVLPETIKDDAVKLAERIRKGILEKKFFPNGEKVSVSASFGVAQYIANESDKEFVKRADSRLYKAKERRRGQICFD